MLNMFLKPSTRSYNLYIASLFGFIERIIKTYIVGNTMNNMLLHESMSIYNGFTAIIWLSIRYIFASHRHIYALKAGTEMQLQEIKYYQNKWIHKRYLLQNKIHEQYSLLQKVGDYTMEMYSRFAIDFVPSTISFTIGIYQLLCLIRYPYNIICALFIISSDIFHEWLSTTQIKKEDHLGEKYGSSVSKTYSIGQETAIKHETVQLFQRQSYEMEKFKHGCHQIKTTHAIYEQLCNYQGSFRHWIGHVINGVILWLSNGNLKDSTQLVMILFYSNEIRRGLYEYRSFKKQYRKYISSKNNLSRCLQQIIPLVKPLNTTCEYVTNNTSIFLKNVSLSFGDKKILNNVSLNIPSNSFAILLGKNGAGKTSLFRILQGRYISSSGTIHSPSIEHILVCKQEPDLFMNESVAYNIAYGCPSFLKLPIESPNKIQSFKYYGKSVMQAVQLLNLHNLEYRSISNLSGGEKQKIGLARILAIAIEVPQNIKLLLLDEHDSALDYRGKELAFHTVQHIYQLCKCIVLSITHNELYRNNSNYIGFIIRDGIIVEHGKYKKIWKSHLKYLKNM